MKENPCGIPERFSESMDEVLETIWMVEEKNSHNLAEVRQILHDEGHPDETADVVGRGHAEIRGDEIFFTATGLKRARDLIRRHRLAERLLIDVLQTGEEDIEASACQMEHILSHR